MLNMKVIYIVTIVLVLSVGYVVYAAVNKDGVKKIKVSLMTTMKSEQTFNKNQVILPLVARVATYKCVDNNGNKKDYPVYYYSNMESANYSDFPLYKIVNLDTIMRNNGKLLYAKALPYEMYIKEFNGSSKLENISPCRIVFVVQIHYPDGIDVPKAGKIKNAIKTTLYDLETNTLLGGRVKVKE
jgi:hypothetical protein